MVKDTELEYHSFYITLQQEYTEAVEFLSVISDKEPVSYDALDVYPESYVLGLADMMGELSRYVLDCLRRGRRWDAEDIFSKMESLYEFLLVVDVPDSMLPGFRKKRDMARAQLEKIREIITLRTVLEGLSVSEGTISGEDEYP